MRRILVTLGLAGGLGLALLWGLGALDALAAQAAAWQREAQNAMARALRALRGGEPGALAALIGLAFTYGVVHAVGPGHGKLLIGGYGAASRVRLLPLAGIALASGLMQATTAVVLVHGGLLLLGWSRERMVALGETTLTTLSTAAIGLIGLWLAWRGARGLIRQRHVAQGVPGSGQRPAPAQFRLPTEALAGPVPALAGATAQPAASHVQSDARPCPDCGHRHGPSPDEVAALTGWRDAALLVGAIAIRPCTGALFLLILTWRMDIAAVGIAGTYAMGLGTALVSIGVAALAVGAREGALFWAGRLAGLRGLAPLIELGVGLLVALVALRMLAPP